MIRLFLGRVWKNYIYWLAVASAWVLLLCSIIYTEPATGEEYTFLSLFYNTDMQNRLQYGVISLREILMGNDIHNYLNMFTPIIVGIPCILTQRTERFVLFRGSKNKYFLSKYISNIVLGGGILLMAQLLFLLAGSGVAYYLGSYKEMQPTLTEIMDIYMVQYLRDVFCNGAWNVIPGILLAEFIRNKYLILCVPFVWNYFMNMFVAGYIPYEIRKYILPEENPIVFVGGLFVCGILVRYIAERRCDCGQK